MKIVMLFIFLLCLGNSFAQMSDKSKGGSVNDLLSNVPSVAGDDFATVSLRGNQKTLNNSSELVSLPNLSIKGENLSKEVIQNQIHSYAKNLADSIGFQGVILVAKGENIIHRTSYGDADMELGIPNQIETKFLLGSLTKSFVSIAILQLYEQGSLNLYDPIQKYIPELKPELAEGLTIQKLLKHQSGLEKNLDSLTRYPIMDISPEELLILINKTNRQFQPGSRHQVSSLNFMLLGMVIQNISGKTYQQFLADTIFNPLQLENTGIERLSFQPENRANGYRLFDGKIRRIEDVMSYSFATADMYSTVDDLFIWSRALNGNQLLSEDSKRLLFDGGDITEGNYGFGFRIQPYTRPAANKQQGKMIRHGGVMNGFSANYHFYKEDDLTIIVLSNFRNLRMLDITYVIKEIALNTHRTSSIKNSAREGYYN